MTRPSRMPEPIPWADGPNYRITIEGAGIAVLRVRRNSSISRAEGAEAAEAMVGHLAALAQTQRGLVMDLVEATTTWGPLTHAALVRMLGAWEGRGLPVRIVPADEPIQVIAIEGLLSRAAPKHGELAGSVELALESIGRERRPKAGARE